MSFTDILRRVESSIAAEYDGYGNSLRQWLIAVGVFFAVALLARVVIAAIAWRVERLAKRTSNQWDDAFAVALKATKTWFLLLLAVYFGSLAILLPERARAIIESITIVGLLLQAAIWGNVALSFGINGYLERHRATDAELVTTVSALSFFAKVVLWSIVLLLALDNMGVDVTALVAGLGVGGIAVALAAQSILGDLFASLSIVLDKPFVLGDFIVVGDCLGTVEKIGLKTTRIRSLAGEQLVFSNNDLLQSRIRNYKRMVERRVEFHLRVPYQTPRAKLAAIPKMIREIVELQSKTRFDRCHFKEYGESALVFETVYYVLEPDYTLHLDIQQDINLAIHGCFQQNQIDFAYPTRSLVVTHDMVAAASPMAEPDRNGGAVEPPLP
jgi:small-conductance mechanosensitive channel